MLLSLRSCLRPHPSGVYKFVHSSNEWMLQGVLLDGTTAKPTHQEGVIVLLQGGDGVDCALHISLGCHLVRKLGALQAQTASKHALLMRMILFVVVTTAEVACLTASHAAITTVHIACL